jgi:hypothetical protein
MHGCMDGCLDAWMLCVRVPAWRCLGTGGRPKAGILRGGHPAAARRHAADGPSIPHPPPPPQNRAPAAEAAEQGPAGKRQRTGAGGAGTSAGPSGGGEAGGGEGEDEDDEDDDDEGEGGGGPRVWSGPVSPPAPAAPLAPPSPLPRSPPLCRAPALHPRTCGPAPRARRRRRQRGRRGRGLLGRVARRHRRHERRRAGGVAATRAPGGRRLSCECGRSPFCVKSRSEPLGRCCGARRGSACSGCCLAENTASQTGL